MRAILRERSTWRRLACWAFMPVALLSSSPSHADWLVTMEGASIETRGAWKVSGRMVVFTRTNGTLSSMRLSEVDLDASYSATEAAHQEPVEEPTSQPETGPSVLSITDADIARGELGLSGTDALVASLRRAHEYRDVGLAMSLVNFQDTPPPYRDFLAREFEWLMDRQIRDIVLSDVSPDQSLTKVHDGVTYEPNVEVTHKLEIELVPDNEDERLTLGLLVGQRLDLFFIAAASAVE